MYVATSSAKVLMRSSSNRTPSTIRCDRVTSPDIASVARYCIAMPPKIIDNDAATTNELWYKKLRMSAGAQSAQAYT